MAVVVLIFLGAMASQGGYPLIYEFSLLINVTALLFLTYLVFVKSTDKVLKNTTAVVAVVALIPSLIQGWSYWRGTTAQYSLSANMQNVVYANNAECFPNNGTLTIAGNPEASENIIQCRHTQDGKSLTYSFMPPQQLGERDVRIAGVGGTFGIDQDPHNDKMPGATVTWTVSYAGNTICRVNVHSGQSGQRCKSSGDLPFVNNQPLVISQVANFGAGHGGQTLYAGIIDPVLVLQEHES